MKNKIKILRIFKPVQASLIPWWSHMSYRLRRSLCGLAIALCGFVSMQSCKTVYIPISNGTEINVKDSTVYHYIDSVLIKEATRYKDMAWLGDSLKIEGQRSRAWAIADTLKGCLLGGLDEDEVKEKVRIVYKDREVLKDTTIYKEIPIEIPVETVKKVYPRWLVVLSILGVLSTAVLAFQAYLKIKKKLPI